MRERACRQQYDTHPHDRSAARGGGACGGDGGERDGHAGGRVHVRGGEPAAAAEAARPDRWCTDPAAGITPERTDGWPGAEPAARPPTVSVRRPRREATRAGRRIAVAVGAE